MKNRKLHLLLLLIIGIYTNSCVEPFDIKTITFESALVVEATISNEIKYHEISLSRTFDLEGKGPSTKVMQMLILLMTFKIYTIFMKPLLVNMSLIRNLAL